MYSNIPIQETLNIINNQLNIIDEVHNVTKQLINTLNTVIKQNYFTYNKFYNLQDGLPMGSPISPIFLKFFYSIWNNKI